MEGSPRIRASIAIAAALLLLVLCFSGLLSQVNDVDLLLYSAAAVRANAERALPYQAAWIEKGPLAMALFQILFAFFGDYNLLAVWGAWAVLALTGLGLSWKLAARMGATWGAPAAAVLFAVSIRAVGGRLNAEVPAAVAAAAAVLAWSRSTRSDARATPWAALAGVLAAMAFLSRQNAGLLWPILLLAELAMARRGVRARRGASFAALALTAGFWTPVAAVALIYALAGAFATFRFCFYSYNANIYIAATHVDAARLLASPLEAVRNFLMPVRTTAALALIGIGAAGTGIRASEMGGAPESERETVLGCRWMRAVVIAVALGLTVSLFVGLRFFSHYFALALPFWAALGGFGAEWLGRRVFPVGDTSEESGAAERHRAGLWIGRAVAAALLVLLSVEVWDRPWRVPAARLRNWVSSGAIAHPSDLLGWPGQDQLAAETARLIRDASSPSDRVFVWGMRPHVPAYAGRVPATRFVTCTFLTGLVPWERSAPAEDTTRWIVPGAWDLLMSDLETERPLFIVDASQDHLFGDGAYPVANFPRLAEYLATHYRLVHSVGNRDRMVIWRRQGLPLTPESLRNAEYPSAIAAAGRVRLAGGTWREPCGAESQAELTISLSETVALGDLDGDGRQDAAVILVASGCGSGVFYDLAAVLDRDGAPQVAASAPLGDRIRVESLSISAARVAVTLVDHGPADPMCCPTRPIERAFVLRGDRLEDYRR